MVNSLSRESVKLPPLVLKPLPVTVRSSDLSDIESFNRRYVFKVINLEVVSVPGRKKKSCSYFHFYIKDN